MTPSPWRQRGDRLVEAQGKIIAEVFTTADDADLIAAAPDLLAALKETTDDLAIFLQDEENHPLWEVVACARAAIAKATGADQ